MIARCCISSFGRFFLVVTVCLAAAKEVGSVPPLPPMVSIVDQFDDVAFGHEHGPSRGVVSRWETGPDLVLFEQGGYDVGPYISSIERHLRDVASLTGLRVTASNDMETGTLRLAFLPSSNFGKLASPRVSEQISEYLANSACLAMAFSDPEQPGKIEKGVVVIGTDISAQTRDHCLLEELVQILGLPNDACHYRPSLFCEDDYVTEMMPADRLLLKALYDQRLSPGQARSEALKQVRLILQELVEVGAN